MSHYSTSESIEQAIAEVSRALASTVAADEVTAACWQHVRAELNQLRDKVERYERELYASSFPPGSAASNGLIAYLDRRAKEANDDER